MSAPAAVESAQDSDRTLASFAKFFPQMDTKTLNSIVDGVRRGDIRFSTFDLHLPLGDLLKPYCQKLQKVWSTPGLRQEYLDNGVRDKPHFMLVDEMLYGAHYRGDVTAFFMLTGTWMLPLVAYMDPGVTQLTWRPCSLTMCGTFAWGDD